MGHAIATYIAIVHYLPVVVDVRHIRCWVDATLSSKQQIASCEHIAMCSAGVAGSSSGDTF